MLSRPAELAQLTASQLRSGIGAVTSSASRILNALNTGDNPTASPPATDGSIIAIAADASAVQLPSPPGQLTSAAQCQAYLQSLPGSSAAIQQVELRAARFTEDAVHQRIRPELAGPDLRSIVVDVSLALSKTWPRSAVGIDEHLHLVELAVESLLARRVHGVVFPALALRFVQHDAALHQLFCELAAGEHHVLLRSSSMELQAAAAERRLAETSPALPADVLLLCGIPPRFHAIDLSPAAEILSQLEAMTCPLEGVQILIRTADEIVSTAHTARGAGLDQGDTSKPGHGGAISSDDLLPLFIAVLVQAAPMHLKTCFEYIRWFHPSGDWNGRTGFQVATLESAIAFLEQQQDQTAIFHDAGSEATDMTAPELIKEEDFADAPEQPETLFALVESDDLLTWGSLQRCVNEAERYLSCPPTDKPELEYARQC